MLDIALLSHTCVSIVKFEWRRHEWLLLRGRLYLFGWLTCFDHASSSTGGKKGPIYGLSAGCGVKLSISGAEISARTMLWHTAS